VPIRNQPYNQPTPIDIQRELIKVQNRYSNLGTYKRDNPNNNGLQSFLYDPLQIVDNRYGTLRTADRFQNRSISPATLRRVASKAWIISICKLNMIRHIEPFLKPSTNKNLRGFIIKKKGEDISKACGKKSKEAGAIETFLLNTGFEEDDDREDTFIKYCTKIINDFFDIDQIATEIRYNRIGKPFDFWAIDAATIEKVIPGQDNPEKIKYVQVIDHIPCAFYTKKELIFDYQNARSDVLYSFYCYSYVEQAIDLITAFINTFAYNAGFFTENKLPRGMLLIDGDASQETIETIQDYIFELLSGNPTSQWRIPIVPSGHKKGEGGEIKWVQLSGNNKEMEFQTWLDTLISAICSLFGTSIDDIGLSNQKSQPLQKDSTKYELKENKSRVLGNILGYLQAYLNRIIAIINPDYELEFVGYECEGPKAVLDLAKTEIETYKTLNEMREEKGLKALDHEWADIPLNPQAVQLYNSEKMGGGMSGMEDVGDMDGMGGMSEEGADFGEDTEDDEETSEGDFGEDTEEGEFEKSLRRNKSKRTIRIVV
jgi:hypothetical protein